MREKLRALRSLGDAVDAATSVLLTELSVSKDYEIDGASTLQRHRHVIIPSIRGVLGFVILIFTMDVVRTFDSLIPLAPQSLTNGNESLMFFIYRVAFSEATRNLGLGSAISVLTIVLILILLLPSIRNLVKEARA